MVGGCLAAASANAINCVLDRDIDERMRRTRRRPLPRHAVAPQAAAIFGVVLGVLATLWLGLRGQLAVRRSRSGWRTPSTSSSTPLLLKRRTPQNIVWGGIAGCFPPLIGWTAVTGQLSVVPVVLFAIVFFWTPPHTWALAIRYREDYAAAEVPDAAGGSFSDPRHAADDRLHGADRRGVAGAVAGRRRRPGSTRPWLRCWGSAFLVEAVRLMLRAQRGLLDAALKPMRLFHWSNSYLALVFVAAAVDPLLR